MPVIKNSSPVLSRGGGLAIGRVVRAYRRDTGVLIGEGTVSAGLDTSLGILSYHLPLIGNAGVNTVVESVGSTWSFSGSGVSIASDLQSYGGACLKCTAVNSSWVVDPSATTAKIAAGTGDFSARIRAYCRVTPTGPRGVWGNWSSNVGYCLVANANGSVTLRMNAVSYTSAASVMPVGSWVWCFVERVAGVIRVIINGVVVITTADSTSITSGSSVRVGSSGVAAESWDGWLSHFDLTMGGTMADTNPASAPSTPGLLPGYFDIWTPYSGAVTVVAFDDAAGDVLEDLVIRSTI